MIQPDFFLHEELYQAEHQTGLPCRVSFAGLWCHADREGRFRWRPGILKMGIVPYDQIDFGNVLKALYEGGFIVYYEVDGAAYGWIPTFKKHQKIHPREAQSVIPPCPREWRTQGKPRLALGVQLPPASTSTSTSASTSEGGRPAASPPLPDEISSGVPESALEGAEDSTLQDSPEEAQYRQEARARLHAAADADRRKRAAHA